MFKHKAVRIKKEVKILLLSFAVGLGLAVAAAGYSYVYSDAAQRGIAENVMRFHVLANSDDAGDQALKNTVRDRILADFEPILTSGSSLSATRIFLTEQLEYIAACAQETVNKAGYDFPVKAEIATVFFPTTSYGDLIFPPGQYETLQITIGDGAGRNWWCLMFPPLCYVEMTGTTQTQDMLEETVPPEGFALLTHQSANQEGGGGSESGTVSVRFRIVEWWQNRRQPAQPTQHLQRAGR